MTLAIAIANQTGLCMETDYTDLDAFLSRSHQTRVELLKDMVTQCKDNKSLSIILTELRDLTDSSVEVGDVFSDSFADTHHHLPSYKPDWQDIFSSMLLFILLALFGMILIKSSFVFDPTFFYRKEILILLELVAKDPSAYIESFADLYLELLEENIITDPNRVYI